MKIAYKPLKITLYTVYAILWCAIILFVIKNIQYGMFKPFVKYFGILSVWIWSVVAVAVIISPIFIRKFIKAAWKTPLISTVITVLIFSIWFLMMFWAVTTK